MNLNEEDAVAKLLMSIQERLNPGNAIDFEAFAEDINIEINEWLIAHSYARNKKVREPAESLLERAAVAKRYRFRSTKRFGHDRGFSCCFRQWRADSHCNMLHGYALAFKFTFEATELDDRNWVIDFGALGQIKEWLEKMFDHTTIVARDDPELTWFQNLHQNRLANVRILDHVGCEAIAKEVYNHTAQWLIDKNHAPRVHLHAVEVWEHEGNSASYSVA
jgi:6-pyruvoyltetrahydropterin/6-carboxytetrahydropterin synthase